MSNANITVTATDNASRVLAGLRTEMQSLSVKSQQLSGALRALGVSLSAAAAVGWARGIVSGLDALNDLKDATGASIENLSALEDVAARTGTSFESMGTSIVKFNAALNTAKPGSDAAAAFTALGLSVKQLKSLDPAEALRVTAVALARFADDGNKARLVQELFGKSLREVAPYLNDLATRGSLVAKVTTEQAQAAERFNQQLSALAKNSQDASRTLVSEFLPALNRILSTFTQLKTDGLLFDVIKDAAKGVVGLNRLSGNAGADINNLIAERTKLEAKLTEQQNLRRSTGFRGRDTVSEDLERQKLEIGTLLEISRIRQKANLDTSGEFSDAVSRRFGRGKPSLPDISGGAKDSAKHAEEIHFATSELDKYYTSLVETLNKENDYTEVLKAQRIISESGGKGFSEQKRRDTLALAEQLDKEREINRETEDRIKLKREHAIAEGDAVVAANQAIAALDAQLNEYSGRTEQDRKRALTARLEEQLNAGASYSKEELDRIVRGIGGVNESLEHTKSLTEELGLTFTSAFEDAIVGGKKLSEVMRGLEQDILRIVTRKLVTEPLGNAVTGLFGSGGGFFSNILGSIFGSQGAPPSGIGFGPRALGGPVMAGGAYLVGERGPELFVPRRNGTIIPDGAGGRSVVVTINQSFAAGTSRATTLQAAADAQRALARGARNL